MLRVSSKRNFCKTFLNTPGSLAKGSDPTPRGWSCADSSRCPELPGLWRHRRPAASLLLRSPSQARPGALRTSTIRFETGWGGGRPSTPVSSRPRLSLRSRHSRQKWPLPAGFVTRSRIRTGYILPTLLKGPTSRISQGPVSDHCLLVKRESRVHTQTVTPKPHQRNRGRRN